MHFMICLVWLLQWLVPCLAAPREVFFDVDSMDDPTLTRSENWGAQPERSHTVNATLSFEFSGTGLNVVLRTFKTYGLVKIELDGQVTTVDTYSDAGYVYTTCALCLSTLEEGRHSVRLTNMGPTSGTMDSGSAWMTIASLSYISDDLLPGPATSTTSYPSTLTASTSSATPHSKPNPETASTGANPTNATDSSISPGSENTVPKSKSLPVAIVAGSVVAGVVFLALVGSFIFWLLYRRYRARRQPAFAFTPQFVSPYQHVAEGTPPPAGMVSEKRRRAAVLHEAKPAFESSSGRETSSAQSSRLSSDGLRDEVRQLREIVVQLAAPPQYASERGHQ